MSKLLIIAIIIGVLFMKSEYPDMYDLGKDKLIDVYDDYVPNDEILSEDIIISESPNIESDLIIEEPSEPTLPEFNQCEAAPYGLPSFEGTYREGEGCVLDSDCLLYPPEGYTGTIIIQEMYSGPLLQCCISDGSCYW